MPWPASGETTPACASASSPHAHQITRYCDFTPAVTDKRALADLVKSDPGIATAHAAFRSKLETWWNQNLPHVEALAPTEGQARQRL